MTEPVQFDKPDALDLLDMLAEWKAAKRSKGPRKFEPLINQRELYVKNVDSTDAPAYACMQVTNTVKVGQLLYLEVEQPADADGSAGWYVFNGSKTIEADGFGIAFDGPLCRMLTDGSTVTAGDLWGPVAGQWTIEPNGSLFVAAGEDDISADVMRGFFKGGGGGSTKYGARMRASWSGKAASCQIYTMDGATLTYKETATVYDPLSVFAALSTDDWLYCTFQDGKYYGADPGNCPDTSPLIADPPATQP